MAPRAEGSAPGTVPPATPNVAYPHEKESTEIETRENENMFSVNGMPQLTHQDTFH